MGKDINFFTFMDKHLFFSNKVKYFGEYLAYRIKCHNKIGQWFKKNDIAGNTYELMHPVQALFHYPGLRNKYMENIHIQNTDWLKGVELEM